MESVGSFSATKAGKSYIVKVNGMHPEGKAMLFQFDSGASVTLLGLNSFCDNDDMASYNLLKSIIETEIESGNFERYKNSGSTATDQSIEMYPCKYDGVSISGTKEITLYFNIYLGNIGMPLLGFDYIDDTSYHHSIGGDLVINAVADNVGKRFYPEKVIDFNKVLASYKK
jgi:hypothetical protein